MATEVGDDEVVLVLDDASIPFDLRQFLVERDLAAVLRVLPLIVGPINPPVRARLELRNVELPRHLLELEGVALEIRQHPSRNAMVFPTALLAQPMPAADPQTAAICIRQCEELLDRRRRRRGMSAAIRTRLIQDSTCIPSMHTVAHEMCVAERTLHRRLAAEGTSYRALLDEVRATLAAELLNSGLTVEETAHRLGYSETSAFTHAHIRWNGYPPSRRRR